MCTLIAKVRAEYRSILSQENEILDQLDTENVNNAVEFDPSYQLEDEEWFCIAEFSKRDFFIDLCKEDFSTASLGQIANDEYDEIQCIVIFQDGQKHFQRITPSRFVNRKTILDYSGQPKIVEHRKQLEVKLESDAIFITATDTLYFRQIPKIKTIFSGIEELDREATQPEVDKFLGHETIELQEGYDTHSVGSHNRKRIADIGEKFLDLPPDKQQKLVKYAKDKTGINFENQKFKINSEKDLKNLLYALDQRYYYADIYEENRVANSVRVVQSKIVE